jgi:hypothetical protein
VARPLRPAGEKRLASSGGYADSAKALSRAGALTRGVDDYAVPVTAVVLYPPPHSCDKLAVRYEATVLVAAINEWL